MYIRLTMICFCIAIFWQTFGMESNAVLAYATSEEVLQSHNALRASILETEAKWEVGFKQALDGDFKKIEEEKICALNNVKAKATTKWLNQHNFFYKAFGLIKEYTFGLQEYDPEDPEFLNEVSSIETEYAQKIAALLASADVKRSYHYKSFFNQGMMLLKGTICADQDFDRRLVAATKFFEIVANQEYDIECKERAVCALKTLPANNETDAKGGAFG